MNIYLKRTELSWTVFIKYYIWALLGGVFFIVLKVFNVIQIDPDNMYNLIYSILIVLVMVQTINARLSKCIIDEIGFRSESLTTIMVPVIAAIGTRVITDILQYAPTLLGRDAISIGKWQTDMSTYNPIEKLAIGTLLGPCFEELLFRVIFFISIAYVLGFIDTRCKSNLSSKVFNLRSAICWFLIIVNNIVFSLMHGPDISSFGLYFIGGVVDTVIYIKYGFYSSWISHGLYNYFSFIFIYRWFLG